MQDWRIRALRNPEEPDEEEPDEEEPEEEEYGERMITDAEGFFTTEGDISIEGGFETSIYEGVTEERRDDTDETGMNGTGREADETGMNGTGREADDAGTNGTEWEETSDPTVWNGSNDNTWNKIGDEETVLWYDPREYGIG